MTDAASRLRTLKYYTLFGFFVIGIVTVLLGQILPILSKRLDLNDAEAGTFFLAQFSGSITGTLIAGRMARRFGFVRVTLAGLILIAIGLPGLNLHSYALCWLSIFLYGSGLGVTIPAINLLTIEITLPDRQSSSVNLVNFMWGLGAIVSQPLVAAVSREGSLLLVSAILVVVFLVLIACFAFAKVEASSVPEYELTDPAERIWHRPLAWVFVLFVFFVIGIEAGLGGWLATYAQTITTSTLVIHPTVAFFTLMVIGRGVASIVSRYLSENTLISICTVTLLGGVSLIVFDEDLAVIGAAIAGLGTSAIFPTNMVRFTKIFGPTAIQSATPLFVSGIIGAACLSSLTGFVSTAYQSLRIGIVVFLFAASVVLVLQIAITMTTRSRRFPRP